MFGKNTAFCVAAMAVMFLFGSARANVIYSSEHWEEQAIGQLPYETNATDYVQTGNGSTHVSVVAHLTSSVDANSDPTGQHGKIAGNKDKQMTLTNAMTLAADGVTSLNISTALYFDKGGYALAQNKLELFYSADGTFADKVSIQVFSPDETADPDDLEFPVQKQWYPGVFVTIDSTDPGITFTDTAKIRWAKGPSSNGMNSAVYLDDVVITGIGGSLTGDTNGDGIVDAADYITMKRNFGAGPGATGKEAIGDFNGDGNVNYADLQLLTTTMNNSGEISGSAIPEPATLALLAFGAAAMLRRRRA